MGTRRKGRILAFQALYAWDTADDKKTALRDLLDFSWTERKPPVTTNGQTDGDNEPLSATDVFSRLLVTGTVENIKAVDAMIRKHLIHWDFSRLSSVDRALLRLSVYELLFQTAPPQVVINEAIDISKEYGTDDSYRFVNGVLDGIMKTMQNDKKEKSNE